MNRSYYSNTIENFILTSNNEILGELARKSEFAAREPMTDMPHYLAIGTIPAACYHRRVRSMPAPGVGLPGCWPAENAWRQRLPARFCWGRCGHRIGCSYSIFNTFTPVFPYLSKRLKWPGTNNATNLSLKTTGLKI